MLCSMCHTDVLVARDTQDKTGRRPETDRTERATDHVLRSFGAGWCGVERSGWVGNCNLGAGCWVLGAGLWLWALALALCVGVVGVQDRSQTA